MPRPGPRRPTITIRLNAAGITWLDTRATGEGITRSELVRLLLSYATARMPQGWRP